MIGRGDPRQVRVRPSYRRRLARGISRLAFALTVVAAFAAGVMTGHSPITFSGGASQTGTAFSEQPGYQTLEDTWNVVSSEYVDFGNVDPIEVFRGASAGLVDGLGDTGHSRFLTPDQAKDFFAASNGELIGIGVQIRTTGQEIVFGGVIDGGPAADAGVQRGDVVLALNGDDVTGLPLDELDKYFDGIDGSPISVEIYRPTTGKTLTFDLVQRKVEVKPVSWTMLPDHIALVRLSAFTKGSANDLRAAIGETAAAGAVGLVFDLRDNGGGLVEEARLIASQFLPEGTLIFREKDADGTVKEYLTDGGGLALNVPLVVLVNRNTASAAEIIAAALSDAGRAEVVGQTTFGTGTILYPQPLDDGSYVVIGFGLWQPPAGEVIWREGFKPDQEVLLDYGRLPFIPGDGPTTSSQQLDAAGDSQVDAALLDLTQPDGGTPEASDKPNATPPFGSDGASHRISGAVAGPQAYALEMGLVGGLH
jgi:carboxyl-terminal processing protease